MHAVWRYPAYGYKTDCCGWSTCNAPWAAPKPMDVIQSQIRTDDSQFRANREAMQRLVAELNDRLTVARQGGGAKPQVRHREQGKLPVRERIDRLIDPVSPFLEFSPPPDRWAHVRRRRPRRWSGDGPEPRRRAGGGDRHERCNGRRRDLASVDASGSEPPFEIVPRGRPRIWCSGRSRRPGRISPGWPISPTSRRRAASSTSPWCSMPGVEGS